MPIRGTQEFETWWGQGDIKRTAPDWVKALAMDAWEMGRRTLPQELERLRDEMRGVWVRIDWLEKRLWESRQSTAGSA